MSLSLELRVQYGRLNDVFCKGFCKDFNHMKVL